MPTLYAGWMKLRLYVELSMRAPQFEEADDLLIGKSGLFHSRYFPKLADFVPSLRYGREEAGHLRNVLGLEFLLKIHLI